MFPINIRYSVRPFTRSVATGQVADLFGLDDSTETHIVADNLQLDIQPGELVLFTGPSGSGKSSILRAVAQQVNAHDAGLLELPERPLIDSLSGPIKDRMSLLSACGLAEPRLMLRRPSELSDGQRYRFRLAWALEQRPTGGTIFADEYAAYLDRTLAQVLSFNLRKLVSRKRVGVLLATTHEDVVEDLAPDLWVRCFGDGHIEQLRDPKKKRLSDLPTISGSAKGPNAIGRISLGGITGPTT